MTEQEALIREAVAAEAAEAVDSREVLAALHARRSRRRPLALFSVVGFTVAAAVAAVVLTLPAAPRPETVQAATPAEPRTVLLAGLDAVGRADSVVLTRVGADGSITAVSLPRDAWVDIPGQGMGTLNSASDPQVLVRAVEAVTGAHVDHYATVDLAAVAAVSTAVGGVEVCLANPAQDALSGVDLPAGKSTLAGDQALAFLRQRHDLPNGDLDRVVRLQAFVRSLAAEVLDPAVLRDEAKVAAVVDALKTGVHTDPGWNLLAFVSALTPNATVRTATVPHGGTTTTESGTALTVDPAEVRAFVTGFQSETPAPTGPSGVAGGDCVN
jgi:LCP family protein required for cell wall assembly